MNQYENLSMEELLKIVIMEKSNEYVSKELVDVFKSLQNIMIYADEKELKVVKGIGSKRIKQLKAISEISRRLYTVPYLNSPYKISCPKNVADLVMADMKFLKQEVLKVILLNTKNVVEDIVTSTVGTLNSSLAHPREIFVNAIKKSSASIILVHNHPSGNPTPSNEDISLTNRIKECGKLLGIEMLDHLIIADSKYISLKERGLL